MKKYRIGIIGHHSNSQVISAQRALDRLGVEVHIIELSRFPEQLTVAVGEHGIRVGDLVLETLDAVYLAEPELMNPVSKWLPPEEEWESLEQTISQKIRFYQESRSVRACIQMLASRRLPIINSILLHRACWLMPALLRMIEAHNIPTAPFVFGNDLEKSAYFVHDREENCAVRRIHESAFAESLCDLQYLKDHHLDFDHFPYLIREKSSEFKLSCLVIGPHCVGSFEQNSGVWRKSASPHQDACEAVAQRVAHLVGVGVLGVEFEICPDGEPRVLHVDPLPDIEALGRAVENDLFENLANVLLEAAEQGNVNFDEIRATLTPLTVYEFSDNGNDSSDISTAFGIAGTLDNAEVHALKKALETLNCRAVPLELPMLPRERALHLEQSGGRIAEFDLSQIRGVFVRTTGVNQVIPLEGEDPIPSSDYKKAYKTYARYTRDEDECLALKYAALEILARQCPVFNPPAAQEVHRLKVDQLFSLQRAGFPVPPTLAGNDLQACQEFVERQGGPEKVAVKPLAGIYKTCLLSDMDLQEALNAGPIILQKYICGDTIRAYIVGGRLIGAGRIIHDETTIDSSIGQTGVDPWELPEDAVKIGWGAAKHLGLSWTGMDFMHERGTGDYYILECNAAAMFANFARMTGFDVPMAIAQLLTEQVDNS